MEYHVAIKKMGTQLVFHATVVKYLELRDRNKP